MLLLLKCVNKIKMQSENIDYRVNKPPGCSYFLISSCLLLSHQGMVHSHYSYFVGEIATF